MRYYTPFTVVLPYFDNGVREYLQLRFTQGNTGRYYMDRRLVRKAIKKVAYERLGQILKNDYINLLLHPGSKWAFRGMVVGSQDKQQPVAASEGGTSAETEE